MDIKHVPMLDNCIKEAIAIEDKIKVMALERAKIDGLDKHDKLKDPKYAYFNTLEGYALFKCSYYQCFECKEPYFGGLKDCD